MEISEIKKLYKKYCVPKHIIAHMAAVSKFAVQLGRKMQKAGVKIDLDHVRKAALLHDILRICELKKYKDVLVWENLQKKYGKIGHTRAMAGILRKMGEKSLAKSVLLHDFFAVKQLKTWEQKILYYADKRIDNDRVVSLKERFKRGRIRNKKPGEDMERIKTVEKDVVNLEKGIRKILGEEGKDL